MITNLEEEKRRLCFLQNTLVSSAVQGSEAPAAPLNTRPSDESAALPQGDLVVQRPSGRHTREVLRPDRTSRLISLRQERWVVLVSYWINTKRVWRKLGK